MLLGVSKDLHFCMRVYNLNSYPDKAIRFAGEGAAGTLNDNVGGIVARPAALKDVFASQQLRQEAAHKGITSTVGVHQLFFRQGDDRDLIQLALGGHHCGVCPLGDDHSAPPAAILLGQAGDLQRNQD